MTIKLEYSLDTEKALLHAMLEQIEIGGFQEKGLLLLEELNNELTYPHVVYPINNEITPLYEGAVSLFNAEVERINDKILAALTVLFPKIPFETLVICPTKYGVKSWFVYNDSEVRIWLRNDFQTINIVPAIVEAFIYKYSLEKFDPTTMYSGENFQKKKHILTFLMKNTILSYLYTDYQSLSEQTTEPELDTVLHQASAENYKQLGYPIAKALKIEGKNILLNNVPIYLTPNQEDILRLLLINENSVVTAQQIADVLWKGEPDKFSLNAISKLIFDIRASLKKYGLYKEVIFTKRKAGYILLQ